MQYKVMQSIGEVIADSIISPYRGSEKTYAMVKEQLRERYGNECAEEFDPHFDAMPAISWMNYGYRIRRGEHALKSVTFVDVEDEQGESVRKVRRVVNLFHKNQVEKV
jgi:hypothetical protein